MYSGGAVARSALVTIGLVIFFGLAGCKSTPAPIIVGDTYTNIEYEYSLKMPRGWQPVNTIPAELKHFEKLAKADMFSLLLYNEKSGGLIAIMNKANRIAYEKYFDISYEQWDKILSRLKGSFEDDMPGMTFKHVIHMENLYNTQQNYFLNQFAYKPEKVYAVESSFDVEAQRVHLNFDSFLFPCRNTRSCETIIILTCFEQNLAQNQMDFEALLSSLYAHDYYD